MNNHGASVDFWPLSTAADLLSAARSANKSNATPHAQHGFSAVSSTRLTIAAYRTKKGAPKKEPVIMCVCLNRP